MITENIIKKGANYKPLVEKIIGRREGALMGHWEQQPPGPAGPASHPHGPPLNED